MMNVNFKKWVAAFLATAMLCASLTACGGTKEKSPEASAPEASADATGDSLTYGILAPLTGPVSVYGITTKNGIELATETLNQAGGVLGKQIKLEVLDEKADIAEATNGYNMLMGKNIQALIGDVTSKPCMAVAELAAEDFNNGEGIPMITPTGTTPDITSYGTNIFRACFLDPFQGKIMATFASENLKAKKLAILYNSSDDYSGGIATAFEDTAKSLGMEIVAKEAYGADDKDFKTQLTKIQGLAPDAIMIPDYYAQVGLIASQAREVGYTGALLGGDGWDGVLGVVADPKVVDGCYFSSHYFVGDEDPLVADFVKAYTAKYNEAPTAFSALGYDAVNMMAEAMKQANSTEAEKVVAAMQALDYKGVTGEMTFDENGDPIKTVAILKLQDGKTTLETKIAAAK